ncbi:MAG: integrase core domain-containing protein [Planctomycetota bacterium]|nr:integrase core domain-containing protein [Planctomycetota bacterium]
MDVNEVLALVGGHVDSELLLRNEYLAAENEILRSRFSDRLLLTRVERVRLARLGKLLGRKALLEIGCIVQPDTVLRWYRDLIAKKFDGSNSRKSSGRPPVDQEVEDLVIRYAEENPDWGCDRIVGALANLAHILSDQAIGDILKRNGIPPAPRRGSSWVDFIEKHKHVISATDFFTVEVVEPEGLRTIYVIFVIQIASRQVHLARLTSHPNAAWMQQVARELTDPGGFLQGQEFLIHDRDSKFCRTFRNIIESAGVKSVRLPPRSPDLNAYAERWIGSIKRECLSGFIVIGEKALQIIIPEFLAHYHGERNHQGVGNRLLFPKKDLRDYGPIGTRERLGGKLKYYYREAA